MADFRPAKDLRAYSGGTVRDFHTILYSPAEANALPQALKRYVLAIKIAPVPIFVNPKNQDCETGQNVVG